MFFDCAILFYTLGVFGAASACGSLMVRYKKLKKGWFSFFIVVTTPVLNYYTMWECFKEYEREQCRRNQSGVSMWCNKLCYKKGLANG